MAEYITMPMYGFGMTEGKVVQWNIAEGDSFEAGQGIAEIETDKLTNSLEAPVSATLLKILVDDDIAKVGDNIAIVGEPGEDISGMPA